MGAQRLDQLFPDGDQVIRELFEARPPAACSAFLGFSSPMRSKARRGTQYCKGPMFGIELTLYEQRRIILAAARRFQPLERRQRSTVSGISSSERDWDKDSSLTAQLLDGVTVVDICDNSPLNPPCTTVKAPRNKCGKFHNDLHCPDAIG